MTRLELIRQHIARFVVDNGERPYQVNAHPEFIKGLIVEMGTSTSILGDDELQFDGIPLQKDESTRSCFCVSEAAATY